MRRFVLGLFGLLVLISYILSEKVKPLSDTKPTSEILLKEPIGQATLGISKLKAPSINNTVTAPTIIPPEIRFVSGKRVALRIAPNKDGRILDRLNTNQKVALLEAGPQWSRVRDTLTLREGYVASHLLKETTLKIVIVPKKIIKVPRIEAPVAKKKATTDHSAIIARIIKDSITSYPGNCPCPYNRDKGGRNCGKRSAYSKPGGYDPICFSGDVTPDMIESFVAKN